MQKTRSITAVGMEDGKQIPLPKVIDGNNYNEEEFMNIVIERCQQRNNAKRNI